MTEKIKEESAPAVSGSRQERIVMRIFPFLNKKIIQEQKHDEKLNRQRTKEDKVFEKFPMYSEFEYMGITCKVTNHRRYLPAFYGINGISSPPIFAAVECDYVDNNGKLHNVEFRLDEMEAIDGA